MYTTDQEVWKNCTNIPSVLNPKILSLKYCCFKIRARERRGMTKVEAREKGKIGDESKACECYLA